MSIMPISVRAEWACDFCHKEAETRGVTPVNSGPQVEPPERWEVVTLYGQPDGEVGQFTSRRNEREVLLCPPCLSIYYKHVGEMIRFSTDFWWSRVRFIATNDKPREIKLPWSDEDRKKDPKNWD